MVLSNARIVCRNEVVSGSVHIVDGLIAGVDHGRTNVPGAIDLDGEFLLPGLVDVHTDNLEKHSIPRPGVFWDPVTAVVAHDAVLAAAGITTVFDSLCVGAVGKPDRRVALPRMIEGLRVAKDKALVRTDHLLHLRCDLFEQDLVEDLQGYIDDPSLRFVTILEDSLRRDPAHFAATVKKRKIEDEAAAGPDGADLLEKRRWIAAECRRRGIPWGNHDDTKAWHIDEGVALGMQVAEFPLTMEAVEAACDASIPVIGGAPNLVAGQSHSGNISMRQLAAQDRLGILCSDYIPASMLHAIAVLTRDPMAFSIQDAVKRVATTPAETFGLSDRGAIEPGRRADLIHVAMRGEHAPILRASWCRGRRAY
ncbi:MAG: alpha-D-ribose 1-methylphosphonate 5-triphosphate diphosphatase [Alphaproteobacteria bacterium]|nr:alpha-D-ribose 1-methylphosphonate 5-triphosphate diphosphatase [Alphaproteobacteria bacterium]